MLFRTLPASLRSPGKEGGGQPAVRGAGGHMGKVKDFEQSTFGPGGPQKPLSTVT